MMTLNIDVSGENDLLAALKAHPEKMQRTVESLLKQEARSLAVSLAGATKPVGMREQSADKLRERIKQDITRLFPTQESAWRVFEFIHRTDERLAKGFWNAYKSSDVKAQARILRRVKLPRGINPSAHQQARVKGRVPGDAEAVALASPSRLGAYIRRQQKKAGLAKAGWNAAALAMGGRIRTRSRVTGKSVERFPAYIRKLSKRPGIGGALVVGGPRAFVRFWNTVPHIGEALPEGLYLLAVDQAERDFLKALNRAVDYLNTRRFDKSRRA